jgi:hypothetical protein
MKSLKGKIHLLYSTERVRSNGERGERERERERCSVMVKMGVAWVINLHFGQVFIKV